MPDNPFITEQQMGELAFATPPRVKRVVCASVTIYSNAIRSEVINGERMVDRVSLERWLSNLQIISNSKGEKHNE